MNDWQLEKELRRHSEWAELGYRIECLKVVLIEEMRLEAITQWLNKTLVKILNSK